MTSTASLLTALALALLTPPAFAEPAAPPQPAPPQITGVVVRVVDLDKGLEFYREVAGFEPVRVDRQAGRADLVNGDVSLWLLKVGTPVRHDYPPTSEAHLNVQVEKLDATLADLARRGVPRLEEKPLTAAIGPNMPVTDPAGNFLYVLQFNGQQGPLPRPKVFNFGITVPQMAVARKFYEGVLGFQVYSEKFYPPALPYVPAGVLQVVLHDGATRPSPPPSPDRAQVNLVLQVEDLEAARRDLQDRGANVRQGTGALGPHLEVLDPFGNVHVVVARPAKTRDAK
jgi:predicted enzyme related to lactoylglutathione lyase